MTPSKFLPMAILLFLPWTFGCGSDPAAPQGARESLLIRVSLPDSPQRTWWFTYSLTFEADDFTDSFTQVYEAVFRGSQTFSIPAPHEDAQAKLVMSPYEEGSVAVSLVKGNGQTMALDPEEYFEDRVIFRLNRWVTSSRKPPPLLNDAIRVQLDGSPESPCFDYWTIQLMSRFGDVLLGDLTMSYAMKVNLRRPLSERTVLTEIQGMSIATLKHPSGTTAALSVDGESLPADLTSFGCLMETNFSTYDE